MSFLMPSNKCRMGACAVVIIEGWANLLNPTRTWTETIFCFLQMGFLLIPVPGGRGCTKCMPTIAYLNRGF